MRKTVRYAVAQGLAAGLALALSACGGDPEPRFEAEPSPTPSEVSSSAPATEAWEEKSDDGAVAFVEHWIDEFNAMRATGKTDSLVRLSSKACDSCSNFAHLTRQIYDAGGSLETEGWTAQSVSRPAQASSKTPVLSVRVKQAPQVLIETSTSDPVEYDGGRIDLVAHLEWTRDGWRMARLDRA